MTIGDALVEARRQAGLTITQVSQRTCIRETIIRGIEQGDFSACGGDFYARGHIRSIARAAGADPEPLVREYDATQSVSPGITAADVFQPSTPIRLRERRRPNWSLAMLAALAVIGGVVAYHFLSGPSATSATASSQHPVTARPAGHRTARGQAGAGHAARSRRHHIVIAVSAVTSDTWVELTTTADVVIFEGTIPAGTSRTWTEHKAVHLIIGDPAAITLRVNGRPAAPGPAGQPVTLSLRAGHRAPSD